MSDATDEGEAQWAKALAEEKMPTRLLATATDVTDHVLVLVANCVEDRFPTERLHEDDFLDRLCYDYLNAEGLDIEKLDTPATRKIMRHARRIQRELV